MQFINKHDVVVTSSKDSYIKLWDLTTGHCFKTITGHITEVNYINIFNFTCIKEYFKHLYVKSTLVNLFDVAKLCIALNQYFIYCVFRGTGFCENHLKHYVHNFYIFFF